MYGGGLVGGPVPVPARRSGAASTRAKEGTTCTRNEEGLALIGDPRNDVHLFVNQLHVAFLRAHNLVVDRLREDGVAEAEIFDEASRATIWHYQWILLHDYLPGLVGDELTAELAEQGPRYYAARRRAVHPVRVRRRRVPLRAQPDPPSLPINAGSGELAMFPDLMGFGTSRPERAIEWSLLFDLPGHRRRNDRSAWTVACPGA